ncbi:unnamed protein product [Rotaria socialis]
MEAVFRSKIRPDLSEKFLPSSSAFRQELIGNHRKKCENFPTGILLPQNQWNYPEPAVSRPDCSTWVRTLPSLSDIYITAINSLGSANTTLRQDIDALEKNADEMRGNNQDLKVKVLELETANLRLCVDNENLKIQLDALEVCNNQLRIDRDNIQEQLKKQTEKFEEFQKRIEKLDEENNGLKGKISSIESNLVKFMLSNRNVEKSQDQYLGNYLLAKNSS